MWQERQHNGIEVGDMVRYRAGFLRSIGVHTGLLPQARGKVTELEPIGRSLVLAVVDWGDDEVPPKVNVKNLERARGMAR